jgi:Bifunctional DNA primase/polymerase, N-terminal
LTDTPPIEIARSYLRRGMVPLPVPFRSKNPGFDSWQKFRVTESDLSKHFNGQPQNIGVILGNASGNLVDVDLDCPEGLAMAPYFLPATEAVFGRASTPESHWLYITDIKTQPFADPLRLKSKDEAERRSAMLVEIRSTGAQTVFPGSTHESGESIAWSRDGEPSPIEAETLRRSVAKIAAASLLARYWPFGARHNTSLALAGGLLRNGWIEGETATFIKAVCVAANDEEEPDRLRNVASTAEKLKADEHIQGWPSLSNLLDQRIVQRVQEWLEIRPSKPEPIRVRRDDLQLAILDSRPKISLPGEDRLLSEFAAELVGHLRDKDIYLRNGEVVILANRDLRPLPAQSFRTWCEQFIVAYRSKRTGQGIYEFGVTMHNDEARGVLASVQFIGGLRHVRRVNHGRLPIIDSDNQLALLSEGYDAKTQTLTLVDVDYDENMPIADAIETINGLLAEFRFADGDRSKAVAIAGMVGLFANQLLPEKSLRPCFVFVANAEGAGKTLLVMICVLPTLGAMPTGCKDSEESEIRKNLTTAILEARQVIFFDNLKGKLSSSALEAFLSAPVWTDRLLKTNRSVTGDNLATVFVTGNGLTVSPDMRRRSLFSELYLEQERAEDKKFEQTLDLTTLLEMRPKMLAALWAMVRQWDAQGRPQASRSHSAFSSWANIVGGIVEAAGFGCPLETAHVTATADPDAEDMRTLVSALAAQGTGVKFAGLVELARDHGLFETIIGRTEDGKLDRPERTAFSRVLTRYDRRQVLDFRFLVEGEGKKRRYRVESVGNDRDDRNDIPDGKA